jgi:serine/threonine-protein kinase
MSKFLSRFKKEKSNQEIENNQQNMDENQQEIESESNPTSVSEEDKSEDERIAEILKAINASESFDYLREDDEDEETPENYIIISPDTDDEPDTVDSEEQILDETDNRQKVLDQLREATSEHSADDDEFVIRISTDDYYDDTESDVEVESDVYVESDAETEYDADAESDAEAETEYDADDESESDTDVETEYDTDAESGIDAVVGVEYESTEDEYEPEEDDEYDYTDMKYEDDHTDNLSVAERAMRDTEFMMPASSDSQRDTEAFDSSEINRINRLAPRARPSRHDYEMSRDNNRRRGRGGRFLIILLLLLAALGVGVYVYWQYTHVEVPDLVGTEMREHTEWESIYQIHLEPIFEYSLSVDEGVIIQQDQAPGSQIRRGGVIRITVSQGVNLTELIEIPNFEGMTTEDIRNWVEEYQLSDVIINQEYSDVIMEGRFIRMEFPDAGVSETNFTRQDTLRIYMSIGIEVFPANIPVPNFVGRRLADVEEWAVEHNITVHHVEATSNTVVSESIIDQNVEAGTMVAIHSEISVTISLGPLVVIPDFAGMNAEEARNVSEHLNVVTRNRYHATVSHGDVISQSEEPGTELIGDGLEVIVYFSLGRPYLESLIGEQENAISAVFFDFTSHGANITYTIVEMDSHLPRGRIIDMSHFNQWMDMEVNVYIWVSRGNQTAPPPSTPGS